MLKTVEKRIVEFAKDTGLTERREIVHGTLYVKLHEDKECDHFHKVIRTFYIDNINPEGGVNMYSVGDEFAFDFVPADREASVLTDEEEKGIWSEFAEEEMFNNMPDDVDTILNLEAESKRGK
jgi:hypothetical protein|tara:strand:+ start:252 stop:620 length:369 start_codon:yes stop_codon:yes gene_type:complete